MKNPYGNALIAFTYVLGVASFFQFIPKDAEPMVPALAAATMLSLLVFSVALMGFLFFYNPARLLMEKEYNAAGTFFIKTAATFAACLCALLVIIFSL